MDDWVKQFFLFLHIQSIALKDMAENEVLMSFSREERPLCFIFLKIFFVKENFSKFSKILQSIL